MRSLILISLHASVRAYVYMHMKLYVCACVFVDSKQIEDETSRTLELQVCLRLLTRYLCMCLDLRHAMCHCVLCLLCACACVCTRVVSCPCMQISVFFVHVYVCVCIWIWICVCLCLHAYLCILTSLCTHSLGWLRMQLHDYQNDFVFFTFVLSVYVSPGHHSSFACPRDTIDGGGGPTATSRVLICFLAYFSVHFLVFCSILIPTFNIQ